MSSPKAGAPSSGRKWTARVLLGLFGLWVLAKVIEVMTSRSSIELAPAFDITNPSLLGILGFASFITYFFVRPGKQDRELAAPVDYAPASKATCDQCGNSFPSSYYLVKSQDNRYLCEACRAVSNGV